MRDAKQIKSQVERRGAARRASKDQERQVTYHDTVVPGENGQFVQAGHKIPPGGDIARDKDSKCEDGKGVHESRLFRRSAFRLRA
jgi:hypothetical protein